MRNGEFFSKFIVIFKVGAGSWLADFGVCLGIARKPVLFFCGAKFVKFLKSHPPQPTVSLSSFVGGIISQNGVRSQVSITSTEPLKGKVFQENTGSRVD